MLQAGIVPGLKLNGVCCRNAEGQALLRKEFSSVSVYTDADDMAAHAAEFGRYNDFQVDDAADIQFFYKNGFHGTMASATGEAPGVNRLEIWGSKGKLTVTDGKTLTFDENEVSAEEFAATNQEVFAALPHTEREVPAEVPGNPYGEVMQRFAESGCRKGKTRCRRRGRLAGGTACQCHLCFRLGGTAGSGSR